MVGANPYFVVVGLYNAVNNIVIEPGAAGFGTKMVKHIGSWIVPVNPERAIGSKQPQVFWLSIFAEYLSGLLLLALDNLLVCATIVLVRTSSLSISPSE